MKLNLKILTTASLLLSSCTLFSEGEGQVIFHWEREGTGVYKFARDHSECMRKAEDLKLLPDIKSLFYSEEAKLEIRADWHAEKGIWATYVPHIGAQPVIVNSLRDDSSSSPRKYRICMEDRGYWHRKDNIPTYSNLFIYRPQTVYQDVPFNLGYR